MPSLRDLAKYTICEGLRNESGPDLVMRQYRYTVCPSHMRYCCSSDLYLGERCCTGSSYYAHPSSLGTVICFLLGVLVMILSIGLKVYFCCLRLLSESSNKESTINSDESTSIGTDITIGGYDSAFDPQVPPPPVPSGPNPTYYPEQPPLYSASIGTDQLPPYPDVISPHSPEPPADKASAPPYPTPSPQHPAAPIGSG
nr:hypothetical transcript [Hymenolepis microstoma]